jgi:hypothetical protein
MNTTNLSVYRIPTETPAWFNFRIAGLTLEDAKEYGCPQYPGGIGASEIGNVLGLQKKYRPCLQEVYHIKSGTLQYTQPPNRAMIRGKILESIVKDIWSVYEGGENESWVNTIMEYMNGDRSTKKLLSIRNARKYNGYFVNDKCPWLFASLDYFAEKNTPGILDGKIHPNGFPVEIKTINSYYAQIWESGVPPTFVAQLNQEMICTNSNYGEIACLFPDEFRFEIFPFYRDDKLCQQILHWGKVFWDKVLQARECKKKMDLYARENKIDDYERMKSIIDSNEPEPDDGEAYNEYIRDEYKEIITKVRGSFTLYNRSQEDQVCKEMIKLLEEKRRGVQNDVLHFLEQTGAAEINFDALGKITYRPNKNGVRSIRFDLPVKPPKEFIDNQFNQLQFKFN